MSRSKNKAELIKEYKRLAATADKRLQRLEKLSLDKNFKTVKTWAYARAIKDIARWRGEGRKRFGQTPPRTVQGIRAKIKDIKTFLESPTSSKKRIIQVYEKRAKTYKEKYGIEATWQQMAVFFERGYYSQLFRDYGSKTAMKILGTISQNEKLIKNAFQKSQQEEIHLSDDKVVNDRVWEAVSKYKDELREVGFNI
jgi:hypothetical protein